MVQRPVAEGNPGSDEAALKQQASMKPAALAPWLLAVPVAALHLFVASWWPQDHFGLGEGADPMPARIEVAFVRELQPAAPAPVVRAPSTRVLRAAPAAASAAALGGADAAARLALEPLDEALRELPALAAMPLPEIAPAPELVAALSAASPASPPLPPATAAAPAVAFEWPPSTRLSYLLTGNYRGPVEGQARVEWRLAGERYQVLLEVGIGPPFAPIITRQLQSDGLVTPAGLEPRRYDELTRIALRAPRHFSISMDNDNVVLPSGRQVPRPPGLQDSASQFVQMTWLFTTQPERLRTGQTVQLPLALARHVQTWAYEVVGEARLWTPLGLIDTVHVRPLRPPGSAGSGGADLAAEFWVAPTLQYLPVRILIRQDEQTWVDLQLERLPQQAAAPAPPPLTRR